MGPQDHGKMTGAHHFLWLHSPLKLFMAGVPLLPIFLELYQISPIKAYQRWFSCYVQHQSIDVVIMQGRKRTILLTSQNEWRFLSMIELMGNISFFFFSANVVSLILFCSCKEQSTVATTAGKQNISTGS